MTIEELKEIVKDATQQAFDGQRISPDEKGNTWSIIAGERLWFRTLLDSVEAEPKIRCSQCIFWDRQHISVEGFARCLTGESGIRYRKSKDYCSVARRKDKVEE